MRYESSIKGDNIITKYDKEEEEPQKIKQNESGALRLTHKSSKNFAQGVDEKIVLCIWNVTHVRQARCKRFNLRNSNTIAFVSYREYNLLSSEILS